MMISKKLLGWGIVLACLIGAPEISLASERNSGKQMYLQYCSSCHGQEGKGDGKVGRDLKFRVPNLTGLAKKNYGVYPLDDVMATIDGRRLVRGHGERKMPVWGETFYSESEGKKYTELTTLLKAKIIAEYVATLQQK